MPLPQSTDPFGALGPPPPPIGETRAWRGSAAELARDGEVARAEVDAHLARARGRARWLFWLQLTFTKLCIALVGLLAAAATASLAGPFAGRIALIAALVAVAPLLYILYRRRPLTRAALGRDRAALARLLVVRTPFAQTRGSELLSSIEVRSSPPPGASGALLSLLHQRAAATAKSIDLREALPARVLRWPLVAFAGALFLCALAGTQPQRLRLGLLRLWKGEAAMPLPDPEPIAGDLSITYLYPAYTGLPARVEEGTPGDLRAPKGTQIKLTARADRDVTQAFAVIDGAAVRLEASGAGNRQLAGGFSLHANGHWRFRYADNKGRPVAEGPDRAIEIIADQAPTATISDPHKSEVEVDPLAKLPVVWSALDDYGLGKVALVWQRAGEPEQRIELAAPETGSIARRLSGTYGWEMAPLELREGDKITFHLEAVDQDAIDGPQKGVSASHTLKVFSAAEHHKEGLARAVALWERLVVLLAQRIEEKPPASASANPNASTTGAPGNPSVPARTPADWYAETHAHDESGLKLVSELRATGAELSKDKLAPRTLGRALKYIAAGLSPLVQRTVIARTPLSKLTAPINAGQAGTLRILSRALESEIREEEKDVLYLDDLLDQARIDDMQELQRELKRSREEMRRLAEKLKSAPDEATKKQLLTEVERLRERVQELMKRMSEMAKGINDEHLNEEAAHSVEKQKDLLSQLADVQKKMQAGDVDAALAELEKLSKSLQSVEDSLSQEAQKAGASKYPEEAKALRLAAEKLSQLRAREEELEKRTGRLRKELRTAAQKRFEQSGGKQLAQKLAEKVAQAKKAIAQIDPHVADGLGLEDTLDAAQERVADLQRALQAGDYQEALEQATRAQRAAEMMQNRLNLEDQMRQLGQPVEVRKSLEQAANAEQPLREVQRALQTALPDEEQRMSQEDRNELQSQESEQRQIEQGMQGVREQMGEVGKKVPIFGPQHEQLLQEAQNAMGQAGRKLSSREPRGAEGAEGEALDKLGKFEQAMKDLSKGGGGQGAGMPMPWGEPQGPGQESGGGDNEGDQEGDDGHSNHERVEIPDAESSRGPQEFRKKLLDAMKQPPPEKFRDKVRGYYEELVK